MPQQIPILDQGEEVVSAPRPEILGLLYLTDFLSAEEEDDTVKQVDAAPWLDDLRRRVQHYGYKYDYKTRRVTASMRLGPLPLFVQRLAFRLLAEGVVRELPDQAIVNEYLPGQGISSHVDCEPCFGETIVTISLGSPCEMDFISLDTGQRCSRMLEPRSALVLEGEARHRWTHGIKSRLNDYGVPRNRRISLTFRRVTLRPA